MHFDSNSTIYPTHSVSRQLSDESLGAASGPKGGCHLPVATGAMSATLPQPTVNMFGLGSVSCAIAFKLEHESCVNKLAWLVAVPLTKTTSSHRRKKRPGGQSHHHRNKDTSGIRAKHCTISRWAR